MFPGLQQIIVPVLIVVSGFVCLEFAFPVAIGEFIAGMIGGQFIDASKIPWLKFFSYLGLLCLMFLAGFEVDIRVLKKNLKRSLTIGLISFLFPYSIVILTALAMDLSIKEALILATALSTTSLAMVYTILKGSNIISTDYGQVLLGSAMIVDIASMISLAVIFLEFSLSNLLYIVVLIAVLFFVDKFVISIFKRYKGNRFEFELKFLLLIFLGLGIIAEEAGFHAAIIAFIVGIIFSDIEQQHIVIIEKLDTVVFGLLAPIFFFHAGSLISFTQLNMTTIVMFFLFFLVAVICKFFGTYFSIYMLYKKDTVVAKYGGIIFNYRLSFGIVAGMYAYDMKLIDIRLLNIIFLIVAISSVFAVFLEKKLEKEVCLVRSTGKPQKPEVKPF